ncbi:hypothetical protein [Synechococcus sp. M16CYN]|uniref:hypothetical protein n=1 Tax=Synechococcus sp. M16CYN TaxID=3103139 RepID=UPI0033424571
MVDPVLAQTYGFHETHERRQIYEPDSRKLRGNTLPDMNNSFDLINRIQRLSVMNDATPPSDAINAALEAYQQQPQGLTFESVACEPL